jgi:hypothetical protein
MALRLEAIDEDCAFLDIELLKRVYRDGPLVLPWPRPGDPGGTLSISDPAEWREFIRSLGLRPGIPEIVTKKFRRAQMLYFLAWIYFDLIKAGELVGLTTLELALNDRYGDKVRKRSGRPFLLICLSTC